MRGGVGNGYLFLLKTILLVVINMDSLYNYVCMKNSLHPGQLTSSKIGTIFLNYYMLSHIGAAVV